MTGVQTCALPISNPRLAKAYDKKILLQFLLPVLLVGYSITVATLDAQPDLTVHDKLTALQNREDVLRTAKATEDALTAKQSAVPKSDSVIKCEFCGKKPHDTYKCTFQGAFSQIMDALTRKEVKRAVNSNRRYRQNRQNKSTDKKTDLTDYMDRKYDSTDRKYGLTGRRFKKQSVR